MPTEKMSAFANSLAVMEQVVVKNGVALTAVDDDHEGVIVEMSEPMDSEAFASILRASLALWRKQGKKGIWIKVPIELVNLVEAVVKEGFWYHHAEPKYLMLVKWISEDAHTLPANASHRVAIGAFVMNEKREVLVVQEKKGILRGKGIWKFPTGVVDEGEDICDAAVREVKEETAIDTEFVELLAFRQSHKAFFGKSDLFFLCMLQPLSSEIQKQELEIEAAEWMPWEEYVVQPFVQQKPFLKLMSEICVAKKDKTYSGFKPFPIKSSESDHKTGLYVNAQDLTRS
ncbi:hypothetical protein K2173_011050 [Erythroxylum novogranatense]|uniref:Nudix hydrolase domain-containing protein n=1 Tax=Erythroxylum novogranatense TaxID=1862640 RepID=A0AAV8T1M2_9ROSI|nr:hypothetical protein K2173_011050 [Erythroxylum novogranatense]